MSLIRHRWSRRAFGLATAGVALSARANVGEAGGRMFTLHTFGDTMLDCRRYNARGVHPGQLLLRNDDALFPAFRGNDLLSHRAARLDHRAVDGATVLGLAGQAAGLGRQDGPCLVLLTVGAGDLLRGLAADTGPALRGFAAALDSFLRGLRGRTVLIGNVVDPSFGDDARNVYGVDARLARANLQRVNEVLARAARRHGDLVDLESHFLGGDASWFVRAAIPSLRGASEVRRAFWPKVLACAGA
ncbi:MAG: SGNH/GDSL hydrolase family protein [Ramlibacter sp.]